MKRIILAFFTCYVACLVACKDNFLGIKPDQKLIVPQQLQEIQALLDNEIMYNNSPYMAEISSGDFWIEDARFQSLTDASKGAYLWQKNIYTNQLDYDWIYKYKQVFYANTALEAIQMLPADVKQQPLGLETKANALFYRAWAFFSLAQTFCQTYKKATSNSDLGIPLRLATAITQSSKRSSVEETYQQIINDLNLALPSLPKLPLKKTRPSKAAAYALLAKTYLIMQNYDLANLNAEAALAIQSELLNYNQINVNAAFPFAIFNTEVVFHNSMVLSTTFAQSRLFIEPTLYQSYHADDLRKKLFFVPSNNNISFKGSYLGSTTFFSGIATDELWLIKAETAIRKGKLTDGLEAINWLLKHRYATGTFTPYTGDNKEHILAVILKERRKELLFRGIRWSDLRRLNLEPMFQESLSRTMANVTYTLEPNSKRYVFPLPDNVIIISGMPQNER